MPLNFQENQAPATRRILPIVLLVIAIILCTLYSREGDGGILHSMQNAVHSVTAPIGSIGARASAGVDQVGDAIGDATADPETLSLLKERNEELTKLLTQSEEYRLEVERLQGLLKMKDTYKIEGISGHVIGRSTDAWNQTVTIDIGSNDGVETGLTVMGPAGVIGQVIATNPGSSTIRLLSDPKSGAAAIVQSSRAEGIVRGSLSGVLYLENIAADVPLNPGDVVLTSGLGGSYVSGLLIGTIVRVEGNEADGVRTVVVAPNEQTSSLEEVMVVFSAEGASAVSSITPEGQSASGDAAGNTSGGSSSASGDASSSVSGGTSSDTSGNTTGDATGSASSSTTGAASGGAAGNVSGNASGEGE